MVFDSLIIGMGPAGLSCATYLKRYGKEVLVIGKDLGALTLAHQIDNYYAKGSISGKELAEDGLKEALKLGVKVNHSEVLDISYLDDHFEVKTNKATFEAKTIFLATGKVRNSFPLAKKYEGKGLSYCATCDGFFYRKKHIAIIGYNDYMKQEFEHLYNLTKDIVVFTNGNELTVNLPEDIKVISDKIVELLGENKVEAIKTEKDTYNIDGIFVALGSQNAFTLAKHVGLEIDEKNNLVVDNKFMTNIPGIFAGGDVVGGLLQVVKAASDGANAAYYINEYLRSQND